MTEKESKKGKKRTGKLLNSFVVLTIVLSVLAVTMLPASAVAPTVTRSIDPDTVSPGGVVDVTISFTTTEDMGSFPALQDVVPEGWVADDLSAVPVVFGSSFTDHTVGYIWWTLGSGVAVTASYKLHVPGDAAGGVYPLNGALKKGGVPYADVTGECNVTVAGPVYGVDLTVDQAERTVAPNENATYTLTVKNTGNREDTFDIAIDNVPAGATATLSEGVTPELAPEGTYDISLNVSSATEDEYIVNVTATSQGDLSKSDKVTTKTNVSLDLPDLIVTEITPNCDEIFGNESNKINATIKNNGTAAAGAFNVSFVIDGFSEEVRIAAGLAAGANTTKCVIYPTLRNAGDLVSINVTADCNGEISELNETDNWMNISKTVVNNGYKGKTYTGGENITTLQTHTLNGSVLYSVGDSYYLSGYSTAWTTYTANWTAGDLPVPGAATIEKARLYVYYTWDKVQGMPDNVNMTFNDNLKTRDAFYTDRKGYGTSNYPSGMLAYDVTGDFNTSGNTAVLENLNPVAGNPSIQGMLLVVVYEKADEPERTIWINEECDLLAAKDTYCVDSEEATAFAPFGGTIDTVNVSAKLITVAPQANEGDDKNRLYFNDDGEWHGIWDSYAGSTQLGINETDVTEYLNATDNIARFQSHIPVGETAGDYMQASNAILVVAKISPEAPIVTNANATPSIIPDDTDNIPLPEATDPNCWNWTFTGKRWETSQLNVTVTDESSNIESVKINLSSLGGDAEKEMTNIPGTNVWTVITNASNSTAGWNGTAYVPYQLQVNATNECGKSNTSVSINLTVMKNGDVTGNGNVDFMGDAVYLVRHTRDVEGYEEIIPQIADVNGDGYVDFMGDAVYLVRHTRDVEGYGILK